MGDFDLGFIPWFEIDGEYWGKDMFNGEYPLTIEEAFSLDGEDSGVGILWMWE